MPTAASPGGEAGITSETAPQPPAPATTRAASQAAARPRGRLPRSARRTQLLAAAHEVFASRGYHAAAMDEIAERAGVSKPVLYQHFPSKLELYLALLDRHVDDLVEAVRQALASTTDNRERVRACVTAYFDFVDGPPHEGAYRLVFESDLRNDPAVRERIDALLSRCAEAIADTVAADTGLPAEEAMLLSAALVGLNEVSARWWVAQGEQGGVPKTRAVEIVVGLAWRGLTSAPLSRQGGAAAAGFADG